MRRHTKTPTPFTLMLAMMALASLEVLTMVVCPPSHAHAMTEASLALLNEAQTAAQAELKALNSEVLQRRQARFEEEDESARKAASESVGQELVNNK